VPPPWLAIREEVGPHTPNETWIAWLGCPAADDGFVRVIHESLQPDAVNPVLQRSVLR